MKILLRHYISLSAICLLLAICSSANAMSAAATGVILVKESENLPVICIPFRSALTSPTHVFVETTDGESRQFFRRSVMHVFRLTLPSPADSPNFTTATHLEPVRDYLVQISAVAETAPCARTFFQPIQNSLQDVIRRFERGERRFNGRWMSLAEYEEKIKSDAANNSGHVELRLKNGKTMVWPRVQIQGQRLVYVSDIGVQAVHRDELTDDLKYLYFPESRPAEEKNSAPASETSNPPSNWGAGAVNTPTASNTGKSNSVGSSADARKFREGTARFFRMRDGTTHIGRVVVSEDEHLVIFTATAKTYRLRKSDIVVGLDEDLAEGPQ